MTWAGSPANLGVPVLTALMTINAEVARKHGKQPLDAREVSGKVRRARTAERDAAIDRAALFFSARFLYRLPGGTQMTAHPEARDFSSRVLRPELLDAGNMPDEDVRRNLLDLRRINRLFGSRRLLLEVLEKQVFRHKLTGFRVLDIASGSCDLPFAILEWAKQQGLEAQVFALEYWHRYLALFRDELATYPNLHPFSADVFHAPVPDQAFDFVTCSHFFHHLPEDRAGELLRMMNRWARYAVIVSDLERHTVPYYFFRLFNPIFTTCAMSRIDGLVSFEQAFRKEELKQTADRAGLHNCTVERRWPYRLLLVAESSSAA